MSGRAGVQGPPADGIDQQKPVPGFFLLVFLAFFVAFFFVAFFFDAFFFAAFFAIVTSCVSVAGVMPSHSRHAYVLA